MTVAFEKLNSKLDELKATVDAISGPLTPGPVDGDSQDSLNQLSAKVDAISDAVRAKFASATLPLAVPAVPVVPVVNTVV